MTLRGLGCRDRAGWPITLVSGVAALECRTVGPDRVGRLPVCCVRQAGTRSHPARAGCGSSLARMFPGCEIGAGVHSLTRFPQVCSGRFRRLRRMVGWSHANSAGRCCRRCRAGVRGGLVRAGSAGRGVLPGAGERPAPGVAGLLSASHPVRTGPPRRGSRGSGRWGGSRGRAGDRALRRSGRWPRCSGGAASRWHQHRVRAAGPERPGWPGCCHRIGARSAAGCPSGLPGGPVSALGRPTE